MAILGAVEDTSGNMSSILLVKINSQPLSPRILIILHYLCNLWICEKLDFFRKKRAKGEISQISDFSGLGQHPDITGEQDPGA